MHGPPEADAKGGADSSQIERPQSKPTTCCATPKCGKCLQGLRTASVSSQCLGCAMLKPFLNTIATGVAYFL